MSILILFWANCEKKLRGDIGVKGDIHNGDHHLVVINGQPP